MKTNFFSLAFLLLINIIYSQNIGDYRTIASGNWEDSKLIMAQLGLLQQNTLEKHQEATP